MTSSEHIVRAPLFPLYSKLKACMQLWDGERREQVYGMIKDIQEQTGTPQNPVDWSAPDDWIEERLSGESQRLAHKLWQGSDSLVNPRHTYGAYLLINRTGMMVESRGVFTLSDKGKHFLSDDVATVATLDQEEGIPFLLQILEAQGPSKIAGMLDPWGAYLLAVSKFNKPSVVKDTLRRRLLNLMDRGYVDRENNRYELTQAGQNYLDENLEAAVDNLIYLTKSMPATEGKKASLSSMDVDVHRAAYLDKERQEMALRQKLMSLSPYAFEHFVKELLEAMDYEDVQVTKQSGDKGIDVVAKFQFGITEITEVVQVKRTESNIGRPVIDALRGALPYHEAIRGTVITLGSFSKGVSDAALFPGAAPITLIDGDKLIELAIKHGVGVKKKQVEILEIDDDFFKERGVLGADEFGDVTD